MGSEDQQELNTLFFALASESRLSILRELLTHSLRIQQIAKMVDLTETEACRQVQKLSEAQLVQKQSNGEYALTTYSRLILDLSSPMEFVLRHKAFVLKHDMFLLPDDLRARLRDLSGCQLITDPIETINKSAELVKNAQKQIDEVIAGLESIVELTRQRLYEGVKVRWLIKENLLPKATSLLCSWEQLPEIRAAPSIIGHYGVTETGAILTLMQKDGMIGYISFFGESASFLKWTEDLFMYEWQRAKPWHP